MAEGPRRSMGPSLSKSDSQPQVLPRRRSISMLARAPPSCSVDAAAMLARDYTLDLPDEILALIFASLSHADSNACSLTCARWKAVDAATRHRLSLDARSALGDIAPRVLARFPAVSKLALRSPRCSGTDSLGDDGAAAVAAVLPSDRLVRLKLRGLRQLSDAGLASLANAAPALRKLSVASCSLCPKAFAAVFRSCPLLEDLSVKRLGGLHDPAGGATAPTDELIFPPASSLRSVCLKDLYSALCFVPLVSASPNLRTLKILRCSGSWDQPLEEIAERALGVVEVHLEKIQVSDRGLEAVSAFTDLKVLSLVKTPECTDAGVACVAEKCHRLRKLRIDTWRDKRIGDAGLMAVARGCSQLQELVLVGVNLTVPSIRMIAECCNVLERLGLCGCETFGDAEIICLANHCAALKKLCINGCRISDRGMEALNGGCPNLVKVKLKRCRRVSYECVEQLKVARGIRSQSAWTLCWSMMQEEDERKWRP